MNWKDILIPIVKFMVTMPLFSGLTKKFAEDTIRNALKGYDANVTINNLKVKSASKMWHIHLDADAELDHEGLTKLLGQIGL